MEVLDDDQVDHELLGLLLSAEGIRDEMRAYEEQPSALLRLAQTGHFVRQITRLHGVLDTAAAAYMDEPPELSEWQEPLAQERSARMAQYHELLVYYNERVDGDQDLEPSLVVEIGSESQQEEVLTLLMTAVDKYRHDLLTWEEIEVTQKAFHLVAWHSNMVVMSLPSWFALPFEFAGTFGLTR